MEGDEVAREADGWIGRMCGFPHVSAVGRRGLLAAKPLQEQIPTASKPEVTRLEETL